MDSEQIFRILLVILFLSNRDASQSEVNQAILLLLIFDSLCGEEDDLDDVLGIEDTAADNCCCR